MQVSNPVPLAIQSTPQSASASASEANAVSETKSSISDDKNLNATESVLSNQEPSVALGDFFYCSNLTENCTMSLFRAQILKSYKSDQKVTHNIFIFHQENHSQFFVMI